MIESFGDSNANFKEGIPIDNNDLFDPFKYSEKPKRKKDEGVLLYYLIHLMIIIKKYNFL